MSGILCVFFGLWGWIVVGLVPFKTLTPVSQDACCPLFLSDCVVCSPTTFFFFSLSQVLGKHKPLWGLCFPVAHYVLNPYFVLYTFTKAFAQPLFFYDVGRLSGGSWSLSVWVLLGL